MVKLVKLTASNSLHRSNECASSTSLSEEDYFDAAYVANRSLKIESGVRSFAELRFTRCR